MLEGIHSSFPVQNIQNKKTSFVEPKQNVTTNPIDSYTMAGLEFLGVYNMSLVKNKDNFNHKPVDLIIQSGTLTKDIEGKKVFDPYGKLEYIVQNDGEYETRYYPDNEKPEIISDVEVRRVFDGKLLKEQYCFVDDNYASITEYSIEQPNVSYQTTYSEGKVHSVEKFEELPDGSRKTYFKDYGFATPKLNISLSDKDFKNSIHVEFDSQNMVKDIGINKTIDGVKYRKDITLNKGAVIGIYESKDTTVPNFMERELLNDIDVIPTDKFDREKLEAVAKNSSKDIYSFYGNGQLKEVKDKNIKIEFNEDGSQHIKEYLSDNITKVTNYYKDGAVSVDYKNGNIRKFLEISSNNIPTLYCIKEDGKNIRTATFTNEGYLCWCE
ncbi:hypothetical protein IKB17_01030 [bacterium]|nr:hypothetical protein [bacterium]